MFRPATLFLAIAGTLAAGEGPQHDHSHGPADLGKLGKVTFKVGCGSSVQPEFNRAVAMIHSFWYAEAEKAFQRIISAHPDCAMAHWGVAMSNYHPIWAPPTPDELKRGKAAAEKAAALKTNSERELDYIAAINAFYADSDKLDHRTRAVAFEKAMEKLAAKYPKDDEASVFYGLALLGTASPNDKTYANQKRAAEVLNRILPTQPEHPGIAHYVIHSNDYPALAPLALQAARVYAKIAPGSPHALHMPSHIFVRLGLWDESISSNLASAEKARRYAQQTSGKQSSFDELHAIDYLVYAHMQKGDDAKARELYEKVASTTFASIDLPNFAAAYALGAVPARYALERRQWKEAAALEVRPADFPWKTYPYAEANIHFARGIGAARAGDLNTAKSAVDRLAAIRQELVDQKNTFWAEQVEIQRLGAQAWLAHAAGFGDEGLRVMRAAAELEDKTEKHPVTPGSILPARELLADMLLEAGKPAEALVEVDRSLKVVPKRFYGLSLAARAAEAGRDKTAAERHYRELLDVARGSTRAEVEAAKNFMTQR